MEGASILFAEGAVNYGSREGTIQKYFANPQNFFKSQYYSQITVEKFDKSKKLLKILRKFVDPQIFLGFAIVF